MLSAKADQIPCLSWHAAIRYFCADPSPREMLLWFIDRLGFRFAVMGKPHTPCDHHIDSCIF